jgi:hypothetical protein
VPTFHDLRHTAVALAIAEGAHPKAIQARLGHASITTTLNTYGHLFPSLDTELADRLDKVRADALAARGRRGGRPDRRRVALTSGFTCGRWRTRTSDRSLVRRVLYL